VIAGCVESVEEMDDEAFAGSVFLPEDGALHAHRRLDGDRWFGTRSPLDSLREDNSLVRVAVTEVRGVKARGHVDEHDLCPALP
jgi:hypothetical protein